MLTVLHRNPVWLPRTEVWQHTQVCALPRERIRPVVVCDALAHEGDFPVPELAVLDRASLLGRVLRRVARRTPIYRGVSTRFAVSTARNSGARVLHSHFGFGGWRDLPLAARAGLAQVVTFYGVDVNRFPRQNPVWYKRYKSVFERADRILCEGRHMADRVAELGCPEDKLRVHHLGVPLDKIPFAPLSWRPGEPLKILMAASFQEKKGLPDGLVALGRLQRDIPLRITLIGDATDTVQSREEKRRIMAAISAHGLEPLIEMCGFQPHQALLEAARHHHLFLSPSKNASDGDTEGGAPVALLEMAAAGMLVVGTRHCDIPDVLADGTAGVLAAPDDVEGLYAVLSRLIEQPQTWEHIRVTGRRHVEAEYNATVQGWRLADIYQEIAP